MNHLKRDLNLPFDNLLQKYKFKMKKIFSSIYYFKFIF